MPLQFLAGFDFRDGGPAVVTLNFGHALGGDRLHDQQLPVTPSSAGAFPQQVRAATKSHDHTAAPDSCCATQARPLPYPPRHSHPTPSAYFIINQHRPTHAPTPHFFGFLGDKRRGPWAGKNSYVE